MFKSFDYTYRHTKVVFTLGPATADEEILTNLIRRGVDVCRFNMAHADHEWTRQQARLVRKCCEEVGRSVALLMDIKGPEIRTGPLDEPMELKRGDRLDLYIAEDKVDEETRKGVPGVTVNYPGLSNDVKVGDTLLVDSGLIRMEITEVKPERVRCEVKIGGPLGSRRHINLPGVHVNLPCLTQKDREDILVGIEEDFDFFALSFVRRPDDVDVMRRFLTDHNSRAHIVSKIEDQSAISNLDDIVTASDGLMIARGDLGIEIPYETLPIVQRSAVRLCLTKGKPVIVATHMLESMITQPIPTRAEITDVANATLEQADCVMLSGETATGKYPVECVDVLNRIIGSVEKQSGASYNDLIHLKSPQNKMLRSAVMLSHELEDSCILAFTRRGYIPAMLSALRPRHSPIFSFTDEPHVFRRMLMYWGVEPFLMEFKDDPEATVDSALKQLKKSGWVDVGQKVIVVSNAIASGKLINTIQLRIVE